MPSPPLAPDDGPIDIEHLQRMTLGNASLEREVLALFSVQAASLIGGRVVVHLLGTRRADDRGGDVLLPEHPGERELCHRDPEPLGDLTEAIAQARMAIDAILRRS